MRSYRLGVTTGLHGTQVRLSGATDNPDEIGPSDLVIVGLKTWQFASLSNVSSLLGPRTLVMPTQNGIDAPDRIAEVVGPGRVLGGWINITSKVCHALTNISILVTENACAAIGVSTGFYFADAFSYPLFRFPLFGRWLAQATSTTSASSRPRSALACSPTQRPGPPTSWSAAASHGRPRRASASGSTRMFDC